MAVGEPAQRAPMTITSYMARLSYQVVFLPNAAAAGKVIVLVRAIGAANE
jgi:hypothetical protein